VSGVNVHHLPIDVYVSTLSQSHSIEHTKRVNNVWKLSNGVVALLSLDYLTLLFEQAWLCSVLTLIHNDFIEVQLVIQRFKGNHNGLRAILRISSIKQGMDMCSRVHSLNFILWHFDLVLSLRIQTFSDIKHIKGLLACDVQSTRIKYNVINYIITSLISLH
jgi:hypothetical protein